MRLTELEARICGPDAHGIRELLMLCPRCRRHGVFVPFWDAPAQDMTKTTPRIWSGAGGLDSLTLRPSVNREGLGDRCGGWHGFITNGEASNVGDG